MDLREIETQPCCRRDAVSEFSNDLVLIVNHLAKTDTIEEVWIVEWERLFLKFARFVDEFKAVGKLLGGNGCRWGGELDTARLGTIGRERIGRIGRAIL